MPACVATKRRGPRRRAAAMACVAMAPKAKVIGMLYERENQGSDLPRRSSATTRSSHAADPRPRPRERTAESLARRCGVVDAAVTVIVRFGHPHSLAKAGDERRSADERC